MPSRGNCESWRSTSSDTRLASFSLFVTMMARARGSCSAWDNKSAARCTGLALSSAMTPISLGPAIMSIST